MKSISSVNRLIQCSHRHITRKHYNQHNKSASCVYFIIFDPYPLQSLKTTYSAFKRKLLHLFEPRKGHHMAKIMLFRTRYRGRVGLSNFLWYDQVAQLCQISIIYSRAIKPDWVHIERQDVPQYTQTFLMWCPPKQRPTILAPTLSHSFSLWDGHPELVLDIRPLAHMFRNPE